MAHVVLAELVTHNGLIMREGKDGDVRADFFFKKIRDGVYEIKPTFNFKLKPGDVVQRIPIALAPQKRTAWVATKNTKDGAHHEECVLIEVSDD